MFSCQESSKLTYPVCRHVIRWHEQHLFTYLIFYYKSDAKTPSGGSGSPESSGKENKMDNFECEQQQVYSIIGSKLGYPDACANASGSTEFDKSNLETGAHKKGNCKADMTTFIGQKGLCGAPVSDDLGILGRESYDVHRTPVSQILNSKLIARKYFDERWE